MLTLLLYFFFGLILKTFGICRIYLRFLHICELLMILELVYLKLRIM